MKLTEELYLWLEPIVLKAAIKTSTSRCAYALFVYRFSVLLYSKRSQQHAHHHHRIITGAAGVSFSSRGGSFVHEFVRLRRAAASCYAL